MGGKRQGDDGATGLDVEVSGDRELKVTEEGSEEVFGGCCFACLMYRKYLVQSVAEGDIPLALLFFRPVLQSWRERILPRNSIGEPSLDQVGSRIGCLQIRNQAILSGS